MKKVLKVLSLCVIQLFLMSNVDAGLIAAGERLDLRCRNFENGGDVISKFVAIRAEKIINTGLIESKEDGTIYCNKLTGDGVIVVHNNMLIMANDFEFEGTILCEGFCTIFTKKGVKPDFVTIEGDGVVHFALNRFPIDYSRDQDIS